MQSLVDLFAARGFTKFDDNLRSYFTELGLKVNFDETLFLLWCSAERAQELEDQGHTWARACNGLIFEKATLHLVCGTQYHMYKTTPEDIVETFKDYTTEKLQDGTFLRLYHYGGTWQMATCRQINGGEANWSTPRTFGTLFAECAGIPDPDELDTNVQYYYVMCHPENRLVTMRPTPVAFLVGKSNPTAPDPEDTISPVSVDNAKFANFSELDDWFKMHANNCHHERGYVFVSKKTNEKLCFEFPEFAFLRDTIRGNNARMDYRYLELLCEDAQNNTRNVDVLRLHWPEWSDVFTMIDASLKWTATEISQEYYNTYTRPRMEARQSGQRPVYEKETGSRYQQTTRQLDAEYHNKKIERVTPETTLNHMLTRLKPGVLAWLLFWDLRNVETQTE